MTRLVTIELEEIMKQKVNRQLERIEKEVQSEDRSEDN